MKIDRNGPVFTQVVNAVIDILSQMIPTTARVTFRDGYVHDIPVNGRSFNVIVTEESYVIVDAGIDSRMLPDQAVAHFPKEEVRSIVFVSE